MDFYTVSIIFFMLIIAFFIYKDRKNIERESVFLLRRTQRGKQILINIGKRFPRLWKFLGMFGVFFGFYISISTFAQLLNLAILTALTREAAPGVGILLPSLTSKTIIAPGLIAPPFWHWVISIAILMVVHEGFHGIMASRESIRIKNLGFVLFFIIPGAFVEPDESQLRKQGAWKQLRVYAAGSFANFIVAFIAATLGLLLVSSFYTPSGVAYSGLISGYPAASANLTGPIVQINNYTITNTTDLDYALANIGPNKTIQITTLNITETSSKNLTYVLNTTQHPNNTSKGFIGISGPSTFMTVISEFKTSEAFIDFLRTLLIFIALINFGVGAFNLLPLWITDGARMWEILFRRFSKRKYKIMLKTFSYITLLIILFTLLSSISINYLG